MATQTLPQSYTVQNNDTLNGIAQQFGFSNYQTAGIQGYGSNPNLIQPGQVLTFAPPTSPAPTVTTSQPAADAVNNANTAVNNYQYTAPKTTAEKVGDIDMERQSAYDMYKSQIDSINKGNLSPEEQSAIDATQKIFDQNKLQQEIANKNYTAGLSVLGIRSGRSRYAPEIEQGNLKASIDQGIQKIQYLDAQAAKSISEMRMAMLDKDYERATKAYAVYSDLLDSKSKSIFDLHDLALKDQQMSLDWYNATHTANQKDYEYYIKKGGTKSFYDWSNAKTGSTEGKAPSIITKEYADAHGLPQQIVGLTDANFAKQLESDTAPSWFMELLKQASPSETMPPELVSSAWEDFKATDGITEYLALNGTDNIGTSGGSDEEVDLGGI